MKNLIIAAVFILTVLSCGTSDPIGPSPSGDAEFYPMTVGNQWVYGRTGTVMDGGTLIGTRTGSCTLEITGTETHSEGFDVFVQENEVTDTLVEILSNVVDERFLPGIFSCCLNLDSIKESHSTDNLFKQFVRVDLSPVVLG